MSTASLYTPISYLIHLSPYTSSFFFFNATPTTEIYTLSLHDALPIYHETNINIIARRTGKDVNSHTVLDGIITTIMDCVTIEIGRAVQQECRDRSRMPSSA